MGPGGIQRCVHSVSLGQPRPPADLSPGASAGMCGGRRWFPALASVFLTSPQLLNVTSRLLNGATPTSASQVQSPSSAASLLEDHRRLRTGLSAPPGPYRGPRHPPPSLLSPSSQPAVPSPPPAASPGCCLSRQVPPSGLWDSHMLTLPVSKELTGDPPCSSSLFFKVYLFIWLHQVFAACGIFHRGGRTSL